MHCLIYGSGIGHTSITAGNRVANSFSQDKALLGLFYWGYSERPTLGFAWAAEQDVWPLPCGEQSLEIQKEMKTKPRQ